MGRQLFARPRLALSTMPNLVWAADDRGCDGLPHLYALWELWTQGVVPKCSLCFGNVAVATTRNFHGLPAPQTMRIDHAKPQHQN